MKIDLKKIIKEIAVTAVIAFVLINIISYLKKPKLEFEKFPKLNAVLVDKSHISYEQLKAKPFVLHFWATWCPTCKVEISNFQSLQDEGYEILTVAVRSGSNDDIKSFLQQRGLNLKVINDQNGNLANYFKIDSFPTTFVFDKSMNLYFSDVGYTSSWSLKLKLWLAGR